MVKDSHQWLKGLLWFGAIYHILLGISGIFFKDVVVLLARNFFNFNLVLDSQTYWILNPLSAYMFIFGIFMAVTASDVVKYRNFVNVIVILLAMRIVQRVFFMVASPAELVSSMDMSRESLDAALVAVYAGALFFTSRKAKSK